MVLVIRLILIFVLLNGCAEQIGTDDDYEFRSVTIPAGSIVDFQLLSKEVLRPKGCIKCHGVLETQEKLLSQTVWVAKGNPLESPLYLSVLSGEMPVGLPPLSESRVRLVENYILDLATATISNDDKQTPPPEPTKAPTPDPKGPSLAEKEWIEIRADFIDQACLKCHSWISDFDKVLERMTPGKPDDSFFYLNIVNDAMPPFPEMPLDLDQKKRIFKYIQDLSIRESPTNYQ